jgi:hypothetical protein
MSNPTITIDADAPVAMLDVSNTLDNGYWQFCADSVMDENGTFLAESDYTYDEFELGPDAILPAGTKIFMSHLWGWKEQGLTEAQDWEIVIPRDATVKHVVHVLLSEYHASLNAGGAEGRFYYIEEVKARDEGVVEIVWGT